MSKGYWGRLTEDDRSKKVEDVVSQKFGTVVDIRFETTIAQSEITVLCINGHTFTKSYMDIVNRGRWCADCTKPCKRYTQEDFEGLISGKGLKLVSINGEWHSVSKTVVVMQCVNADHPPWPALAVNVLHERQSCKLCSLAKKHNVMEESRTYYIGPPSSADWAEHFSMSQYYDGIPCLNSHISPRYTKNKSCVECTRLRSIAKRERRDATMCRLKTEICELCGKDGIICFDHDHVTGNSRGWLCKSCNSALGFAHDNPAILINLALYLRQRSIAT